MSTPPEFPKPAQVPGEPAPPREPHEIHRARVPDVVDDDTDLFGVEDAAARLTNGWTASVRRRRSRAQTGAGSSLHRRREPTTGSKGRFPAA
jgi:hypothetical protein